MSSGTRIVKPSDDAASLAISNKLRADIAALEQAGRNASQGASLLQVANGAYDRIGDMLARMKVLATQVINGTLGTSERLFAQEEFVNLRTQITNTATQTRFGSVNLLSGGGGQYAAGGVLAALVTNSTANTSDLTAGAAGLITSGNAQNDYFTTSSFAHSGAGAGTTQVNSGYVHGAVSDINVSISGQAFQVSMKVGNQTFVGRIDSVTQAAASVITLSSTVNSANTIQMTVTNAVGTNFTESVRARVETGMRTLLAGATFTGVNTAGAEDNGFTGVGSTIGVTQNGATVPVVAGAGTTAGTYTFQYVSTGAETAAGATGFASGADDRRGTGFFVLTNGANTWTVDQKNIQIVGNEGSAGSYGIATFGNGLQVYVNMNATAADSFDRGTSSAATFRFDIGQGGGVSLSFQVSDNANDQASINFNGATAGALGLEGLSIADVTSAATASSRIDTAINVVNTAQAGIGALQSRFEYIQSTISTTVENVSAARGTFRDVDMAAEMTSFTRSQTLMQASIAMLSQANQMPQQLLRLLQ
jgi:flagellin